MPLFVASIFLSAFLLFQIQPVIARYILPWYGGSPAVWTSCLLFFQVGLLAGYGYAHALVSVLRGKRRVQIAIHLGLLLLAVCLLPITPSESLKPDGSEHPVLGIVRLLGLTVGFPYLLLSASGPLLQHWFSEAFPTRSPYRLYAISNAGSLLGLISYPFLFEPLLRTSQQTLIWSWAFAAYAILAAACAVLFVKNATRHASSETPAETTPPTLLNKFLWVAFAACGSMLLLSLTNQMCQDVAVVPFLWVIPLSLYLLTFVISFDHSRWYRRRIWIPAMTLSIAALVVLMNRQFADVEWHLGLQIAIYCGAVFFSCMVCHGEVVRLKPANRYLTEFYLLISLGGAIGGIFVSLIAPLIFNGYRELHFALILLAGLTSIELYRRFHRSFKNLPVTVGTILWIAFCGALVFGLARQVDERDGNAVAVKRGFYGVLQVSESYAGTDESYLSLYHGRISHGRQYQNPEWEMLATTYYAEKSGVSAALSFINAPAGERHVGIIGLGVGTIATLSAEGDRFRFYEINPQVEEMAREHFTYLEKCEGEVEVVIGDARIVLEQELQRGEPQQFDALFVDAFSGDSIPLHLMTKEAFALYFQHLKPDGVLVVHITNLHLDLSDPVRNLANEFGYTATRVEEYGEDEHTYYSDWVLISKDENFLQRLNESDFPSEWEHELRPEILWTDDYCNLLDVIYWSEAVEEYDAEDEALLEALEEPANEGN
ncbi:MAG: fused MFS/spermidine synthase [Verrucomicrobiales bacterium]|nr:fused MFS/spermidine synthase [Verrucomicrobiales bacterium]